MRNKSVDIPFLLVLCALVAFGLLIFTSAALGLLARDGASFSSVTIKQLLVGLVLGGIAAYFVSRMDYRKWRAYTPHFFGFALFLTALTLIPHIGLSLKGASRWLVLGPVSFQPEEVLKLATIAMLAAYYAARMRQVPTLKGGILPLLAIAGPAALILLLQPNTAGVAMLGATSIVVFFAAGGRLLHMGLLALLCALAIGGAALMYPHVSQRIETFLDQSSDPQGAGWQIQQSLIAVGSGGFFGRGFGQGIEKFSYLPEPIGDSIFAVAGEEFGFVGSVILVGLFIALGLLGLRIAARAPDPFGGLLVIGLVVLIVGQSFFNIASSLGLVPLVGVPLIFVSNGGTALAMAFVEAGVIVSVSRRMKKPTS